MVNQRNTFKHDKGYKEMKKWIKLNNKVKSSRMFLGFWYSSVTQVVHNLKKKVCVNLVLCS